MRRRLGVWGAARAAHATPAPPRARRGGCGYLGSLPGRNVIRSMIDHRRQLQASLPTQGQRPAMWRDTCRPLDLTAARSTLLRQSPDLPPQSPDRGRRAPWSDNTAPSLPCTTKAATPLTQPDEDGERALQVKHRFPERSPDVVFTCQSLILNIPRFMLQKFTILGCVLYVRSF